MPAIDSNDLYQTVVMQQLRARLRLLAVVLQALVLALVGASARAQETADLVIENVTVIDPEARSVLPHHSVYITKGRIRSVERYEQNPKKPGRAATKTIVGKNRFLIPGLLDMHVHLALEETQADVTATLDLLLANGVTGVRDMASDCWPPRAEGVLCIEDLRSLEQDIRSGKLVGPRILALSSGVVRGVMEREFLPAGAAPYFAPETAEQGRELARYLAERGVDLVKIYNTVPRDAYFALVEEAQRLEIEVSGHLPLAVSLLEASTAGHKTIEHARDLPLACSRYGAHYRETMHHVVERHAKAEPPDAKTRLERALEEFDSALCDDVLETLAKNGTYLVPTHGTREMDARAQERSYRSDRRLRYIGGPLRGKWEKDLFYTAQVGPLLGELYHEFYHSGLRLTGMAHAAGVKIMVGTDANDTMIFPGFGLHDELVRLETAGLKPMEILRAATFVPAEYLGLSEDLGGIAPGKLADLVLLRANPLQDIRNTRKIQAVVFDGKVHDRKALDARLRQVAAKAAESALSP